MKVFTVHRRRYQQKVQTFQIGKPYGFIPFSFNPPNLEKWLTAFIKDDKTPVQQTGYQVWFGELLISQLLPDNNGTRRAPLTRACSYELVLQNYFATSFAKSHNFQRHSYMPLWHKVVWLATRRKIPGNEQPISNQFKVFQKETVTLSDVCPNKLNR